MENREATEKPKPRAGRLILEDECLRDGLQMEARVFSLEEKLYIFDQLKKAGLRRIQVGSFVHPKLVPQMADTDDFIKAIGPQRDVVVSALILNAKGLERALASGVPHVSMSVSASETHSLKNARRPAREAAKDMAGLIAEAVRSGLEVRAGVQCAFGCAYEGAIDPAAVLDIAASFAGAGAAEINLADTTGMANPNSVARLVKAARQALPGVGLSLHLHDTRGMGLVNLWAGFQAGVRVFDVCAGGLGGCPFVTGAAGNVPSEDAVNMLESLGVETGVSLSVLCELVGWLQNTLERPLPGRMTRVLEHRNGCA